MCDFWDPTIGIYKGGSWRPCRGHLPSPCGKWGRVSALQSLKELQSRFRPHCPALLFYAFAFAAQAPSLLSLLCWDLLGALLWLPVKKPFYGGRRGHLETFLQILRTSVLFTHSLPNPHFPEPPTPPHALVQKGLCSGLPWQWYDPHIYADPPDICMLFHGENKTDRSWRFLWFTLSLTLFQWVIKGFAVTFTQGLF